MKNTEPKLPMAAEALIPHRRPMRLVDRLLTYDDSAAEIEAVIRPENAVLEKDGSLHPAALVEMIAQAFAAAKGYENLLSNKPVQQGFLVGIRKFAVSAAVRPGDRLQVRVKQTLTMEGVTIAEGQIYRGAEQIAAGSIKLWINEKG